MLILLDIDGVMVPASNWKTPELLPDGFPQFSNKAINGLNKVLYETGCSIVLTTSHRATYTVTAWKEIFSRRGIEADIAKLNVPGKFATRKEEILAWIRIQNSEVVFVIIDDDKSLNDLPVEYKKKLVLTSPLVGLNDDLADQAIHILQQPALAVSPILSGITITKSTISINEE